MYLRLEIHKIRQDDVDLGWPLHPRVLYYHPRFAREVFILLLFALFLNCIGLSANSWEKHLSKRLRFTHSPRPERVLNRMLRVKSKEQHTRSPTHTLSWDNLTNSNIDFLLNSCDPLFGRNWERKLSLKPRKRKCFLNQDRPQKEDGSLTFYLWHFCWFPLCDL